MSIRIIQTADPSRYWRMLRATSRTATEYARRHGFDYQIYVGIKRGSLSVHAAFNRMFMLHELYRSGYRGWVLYMDADAYIWDLDFDLTDYLADKQDRAAVMATIEGSILPWSINSGVLLFNLSHPVTGGLLEDWLGRYLAISESEINDITSVWEERNDQLMLFQALDENKLFRDSVYYEESILLNHKDGRFIRQFLGAFEPDVDTRTREIELEVAYVLRGSPAADPDDPTPEQLVTEQYLLYLGRLPDAGGLDNYVKVIDIHGPSTGLKLIAQALLHSDEYLTRMTSSH